MLWGKDYLRPAAVTVLRGQAAEVNESLLVVPDYVAYGSGDGSFSLADDPAEAFSKAVAQAAGFAKLSSPTLSQITREQYRAAMTGFESVQLSFRYALPTAQFCEYYGSASSRLQTAPRASPASVSPRLPTKAYSSKTKAAAAATGCSSARLPLR